MQLLVVMAGTTGSGKTTVAMLLASRLAPVEHIESDVVRKRRAGLAPTARVGGPDLLGGIYSKAMTDATYGEMQRRARRTLAAGSSVILDASHRRRALRRRATDVGRRAGIPVVLVECHVHRLEQLERLEQRYRHSSSASDGRPDVLSLHERDWELVGDDEADVVLRVDTSMPLAGLRRDVAERWARAADVVVGR
jgi:predicted kinase